jgi:dihydroorotase
MPNTNPPLDSATMVRFVQQRAALLRSARVYVVGCATAGRAGQALAEMAGMARAGAVGFTDDGSVVADPAIMASALRTARALDRCLMQHCQEPSLTRGASMNAGPLALRLGLVGWPAVAEELIIERDLRLNDSIGCRYHVQHVSSGESVELVRQARRRGQPVTAEATPHHLLLTEEACRGYDTMAKVNPPLRKREDIRTLKEAIADGTITILASDHAPHPRDAKRTDFASAAFGIVGLDCALPLYARALVDEGVIDWPGLLAMMTSNPAGLTGLDKLGLGALAPGGPADLTLIDPGLSWTIDAGQFASIGRNCPFDGWTVTGRAVATIASGRVVHSLPGERLHTGMAETQGERAAARPQEA